MESQSDFTPMSLEEQEMHKAFAKYYGEEPSCKPFGKPKVRYNTEKTATKSAKSMSLKTGKIMEAYPCPFCDKWHIGRAMGSVEREIWSDPELRKRIPPRIKEWESSNGMKHHAISQCEGRNCSIHNPSDHHMKDWPLTFRFDRYPVMAERHCPHGTGHPDPDHMAWLRTWMDEDSVKTESTHGCCPSICCEGRQHEQNQDNHR